MNSESQKAQLTLRIPQKLNKLLTALADKTGIAKNALITTALWKFVEKN